MSSRDRERRRRNQARHLVTAVALDELFTDPEASAELAAVVDRVREHYPGLTAHGDQVAAARRDVAETARAVTGGQLDMVEASAVPEWLRLSVFAAITAWIAGDIELREHEPDPLGADIVCAAAWHPGLLTCLACSGRFSLRGLEADKVCDCCGHVCTGAEHGDGITPVHLFVGNVVYAAGVCRNCATSAGPTAVAV